MYRIIHILILTIFAPILIFSQSLKINHVYKIPEENFDKYDPKSFIIDSNGNYCYEVKIDSFWYYYTNNGLVGKSDFIGGTIGKTGSISYTSNDNNYNKPDTFWYRSNNSPIVYGPEHGKLEEYFISPYGNGIAVIIRNNDSLFYKVNGIIVFSCLNKEEFFNVNDWCVFNRAGDYLLIAGNIDIEILFLNGNSIDTAKMFNYIFLDDIKNYSYIRYNEGFKPEEIINNDKIIYSGNGYTRTIVSNSGKKCFYISDEKIKLVFENTSFVIDKCAEHENDNDDFENNSRTKIYTNYNSFIDICNSEKKVNYINFNNQFFCKYDDIYGEICDSLKNCSFFVLKDYYLYSITNGIITDTISMNGKRGKPIYISPKGDYVVYYNINDSVYFFRNKEQLNVIHKNKKFRFGDLYYGFRFYDEMDEQQKDAKYLTIDNESFVLIGENIYGPYLKFTESYKMPGYIESGEINEKNEFYFVQVSGDRKCRVIINGKDYGEFDYDELLENSILFDGNEITFYIINLGNVYQIKTLL